MDEMIRKNYRSDFDAILSLYACAPDGDKEPREVGWPDYDWEARFYTEGRKTNAYVANCKGGVCTNCFNDNGKIHVVFDNHRLGMGVVQVEFRALLPDSIYPDGTRLEVSPQPLGINLVADRGDCGTAVTAKVICPYIKFKYEDLTDEEKAEISKPATDAAASVEKLEEAVSKAEAVREANEDKRVADEKARVTAEQARQTAETEREEAESDREEAETGRVSAEEKRAEQFATWETEIDSKAARSELSNVIAEKSDDGTTLKERGTGEVMYPQTLASLVKTSDGGIVEEAINAAKYKLLDDQWTAADGTVIVSGHTYGLNGVNDLTYEEAIKIMSYYSEQIDAESRMRYAACPCRTLLPIRGRTYTYTVTSRMFFLSNKLEVLVLTDIETTEPWGMFDNCSNLRTIDGIIGVRNQKQLDKMFAGCKALKEVRISYLGASISFADSPLLSLASLQYLVTNAVNTSAITVTVHADVYAKLTGDTTNEAASTLTAEELAQWQALVTTAADKNISFATT